MVALKQCRIVFHLSSEVVALDLDNSSAKAYLYIIKVIQYLFLFRLALHILNMDKKHGITLYSNIHTDYLSWGQLVPEELLPHVAKVAFQLWCSLEVTFCYPHVPINVSNITPWKICYLFEP